jgi:hypothetical protein
MRKHIAMLTPLVTYGIDHIYDTKAEHNILRFGAGVDSNNIQLHLGSLMLDLGNGDAVHIEGFNSQDVFNTDSIGRTRAENINIGKAANDETANAWRIAA